MDLKEFYEKQRADKISDDIWKDWQESKKQESIDNALEKEAQARQQQKNLIEYQNLTEAEKRRDGYKKRFALLGLLVGFVIAIIVIYFNIIVVQMNAPEVRIGGGPIDDFSTIFKGLGLGVLCIGGGSLMGGIIGTIIGKIKIK